MTDKDRIAELEREVDMARRAIDRLMQRLGDQSELTTMLVNKWCEAERKADPNWTLK